MRKSILGHKFGNLTVVAYDGVKSKNSYWICECECGKKFSCCRTSLVGGNQQSCGWDCESTYSLVGKSFGLLTVLNRAYMKNNTSYWNCLCQCKNKVIIKRSHLGTHHVSSCGCLMRRQGKSCPNWSGCGEISGSVFSRIRTQANRRKITFDLEIEHLWDLFLKQNGKCALSGIELTLPKHQLIDCTASLDRIDSSCGYVVDNIQWLHKTVNFMKLSMTQSEFLNWCKKIVEFNQPKLEQLL